MSDEQQISEVDNLKQRIQTVATEYQNTLQQAITLKEALNNLTTGITAKLLELEDCQTVEEFKDGIRGLLRQIYGVSKQKQNESTTAIQENQQQTI